MPYQLDPNTGKVIYVPNEVPELPAPDLGPPNRWAGVSDVINTTAGGLNPSGFWGGTPTNASSSTGYSNAFNLPNPYAQANRTSAQMPMSTMDNYTNPATAPATTDPRVTAKAPTSGGTTRYFYRDNKGNFFEVGTNKYIGPNEFNNGAGWKEVNKPADANPQMPGARRTDTGGIETLVTSPLEDFKNRTLFLDKVKELIQKKNDIMQPLTDQKAYWRTMQDSIYRSTFEDKDLQKLSPGEQASIRGKQYAAAGAQLAAIREEEAYRGGRIEDVLKSITGLFEERDKALQNEKTAAEIKKLNMEIAQKGKENGFTIDNSGNVQVDLSSATVDNIVNTIKQIESGGNYEAKGASGEYGAYQFMPGTWDSWSSQYANEILGQSTMRLEPTPENQDAVAKWKIQKLLDQDYTPRQIASIWNSGSPEWEGKIGTNKQGVNYNVPNYVNKFSATLGTMLNASIGNTYTDTQLRGLLVKLKTTPGYEQYRDLAKLQKMSDDDLTTLEASVNTNFEGLIVKAIRNRALELLNAGITADLQEDFTSALLAGFTDQQIQDTLAESGYEPTLWAKFKEILSKENSLAQLASLLNA